MVPKKVTIRDDFWKRLKKSPQLIHLVLIATKPDIIKQAPIILELKKREEPVFIGHTGQHYDWNLSGGLEQEFNIEPDFNLNIGGSVYEKVSQIVERLGGVIEEIRRLGKEIVPYIHGDTTTAMASGLAFYLNMIACVHIEAGLRTLTPRKEILDQNISHFNFQSYYQRLKNRENWTSGSIEPYPEQLNTRVGDITTGLYFCPTKLNQEHLISEGFYQDRIFVVGNTVADSIDLVQKKAKDSKIFEKYPLLGEGFVRFCIHRRENLSSFYRFSVLIKAMEKMIKAGYNVLFISLPGTEKALGEYNLKKKIKDLDKKYDNFIYSSVWPLYTDVIAAMKHCKLIATDSGSLQEEANILGVPCATLRFNSDRPESVFAGGNVIAPPVNVDLVFEILKSAYDNSALKKAPKIYGQNVSEKIIDIVLRVSRKEKLFRWEHQKLGYDKESFWQGREVDFT